jgi:hypothetical protein
MSTETNIELQTISEHAAYLGTKRELDTIVFVHGLKGNFQETWGAFPELLRSDPDLPKMDVLLWGYKSYAVLPTVKNPKTIGTHLVSCMAAQISSNNNIQLVGHSMGGLVILEGLLGEMKGQRAKNHPTLNANFISLFASPISGVSAARSVVNTLGIARLVNAQVRALARGEGVDALLTETHHRIYNPNFEDSSARKIPIRLIMATNDGAVDESDRQAARARFKSTQPLEFNYDHTSIKEPTSHMDNRYRALVIDVQQGFAERFHQLCIRMRSVNPEEREVAELDLNFRYAELLEECFMKMIGDPKNNRVRYESYLQKVVIRGSNTIETRPPYDIARLVLIKMLNE